jgi:uncharacterized RDD family membrane protein YckC
VENAGVALRFVAIVIDTAVFFVVAVVLAAFTGGTYAETANGGGSAGFQLEGGPLLLWIGLFIAYHVVCEGVTGQTLGKRVVGIRVVDEEGARIGWGASFVRNILRLVDGLFFYLIGAFFASSSPKGQRIGDRAAHTLVVRG